ncbi:MAG: glycoside hydrolase family 65 protein [Actinomycetia bacterium]|nr:glycoside hydrolase family 65 protein [Actinomycetes bacterium]MCP4962523.1 glycoside hydrolase family 65 protein [Actinomycetes bacterium]
MRYTSVPDPLPQHRFPADPWRLVETEPGHTDLGLTETLFANCNGYIGMRANPSEGREAHTHGTFLNGFHETWPIQHAEAAHAFAKTGQTIVNVPDAKLMKLYIDDEPLLLADADLDHYERVMDFRTGWSYRDVTWRSPAGKRIKVRSTRMVSLVHRHIAVLTFEIELLDSAAPVVVSSQLLNRQDGEDEYHVRSAALGEGVDPREARRFDRRVLVPRLRDCGELGTLLGYRTANSEMTLACAYEHEIDTSCEYTVETDVETDLGKTVFSINAVAGSPIRITKYVSYHSSRGVPVEELADRCTRTIKRARQTGLEQLRADQRQWLDEFWDSADIEIEGDDVAQQAIRWNLFQLAQASACTHEHGIAAKAVTGGGYDGHYFWDTEIYVVPFLAYTNPEAARKLLRFRWRMLDDARNRAAELSQDGALFPWRTINGEEASAYYAAGTAQYHINAAVVQALERYYQATGDMDFLSQEGAEILVETARLYEDLGFYSSNSHTAFKIHRVTGPDEYTTVVNDNLYTNVMARFNMRFAANTVGMLKTELPEAYEALKRNTGLEDEELARWHMAADAMYLPFDEGLGIHQQDANFLDLEPWDWKDTPPDKYPLLLNFHPLVIYRHQVLKQADVVLAMYLRGEHFSDEQRRRNFDYYDPITTGDSSLSACIQSVMAAQVGYDELAYKYFQHALYLDLVDTQGNTSEGVHLANAGGVWLDLVHGFAGIRDVETGMTFSPRLPEAWKSMRLRMQRRGTRIEVVVTHDDCTVRVLDQGSLDIERDGQVTVVGAGEELVLPS